MSVVEPVVEPVVMSVVEPVVEPVVEAQEVTDAQAPSRRSRRKAFHAQAAESRREGAGSGRRSRLYKTKMCEVFPLGKCTNGAKCHFAHSEEELRAAPDLRKTSLCHTFMKTGECDAEDCPFAHGYDDLRFTQELWKTSLCTFWGNGNCKYGDHCRHAHGEYELRRQPGGALGKGRAQKSKVIREDQPPASAPATPFRQPPPPPPPATEPRCHWQASPWQPLPPPEPRPSQGASMKVATPQMQVSQPPVEPMSALPAAMSPMLSDARSPFVPMSAPPAAGGRRMAALPRWPEEEMEPVEAQPRQPRCHYGAVQEGDHGSHRVRMTTPDVGQQRMRADQRMQFSTPQPVQANHGDLAVQRLQFCTPMSEMSCQRMQLATPDVHGHSLLAATPDTAMQRASQETNCFASGMRGYCEDLWTSADVKVQSSDMCNCVPVDTVDHTYGGQAVSPQMGCQSVSPQNGCQSVTPQMMSSQMGYHSASPQVGCQSVSPQMGCQSTVGCQSNMQMSCQSMGCRSMSGCQTTSPQMSCQSVSPQMTYQSSSPHMNGQSVQPQSQFQTIGVQSVSPQTLLLGGCQTGNSPQKCYQMRCQSQCSQMQSSQEFDSRQASSKGQLPRNSSPPSNSCDVDSLGVAPQMCYAPSQDFPFPSSSQLEPAPEPSVPPSPFGHRDVPRPESLLLFSEAELRAAMPTQYWD